MVNSGMTTETFIQKTKELELQYNSRGVGNEDVISYHYKVGAKYGDNGSYLIFDTGKDDVVEKVEYLFFPTKKRAVYRLHEETDYDPGPAGYSLKTKDRVIEFSDPQQLLDAVHDKNN